MTTATQATTQTTNITDLVVNSKKNCYHLFSQRMTEIQNTGVNTELQPGIHVIRIRKGSFDYVQGDVQKGEPIVMLWIYGGKFKNLKTNIEVPAGWSTLNGYDDTLTLAVSETSTLCAFFFDVEIGDNDGDVTVSVIKVGELNDLS
ncbi:hypothetical protein NIES4073_61090 [Kalymmatonema gypsitolerans NIES-4073]|uniref:hypothetical protein n=1 Tax=Scytonema sp. PRP1 TaxID=3120513 RepID=UPI000B619E84|nr:hypothetical protein NIES4073_61090 [Scytonema sp. NIES-4073]